MKEFLTEDDAHGGPSPGTTPSARDKLRELVRFAMRQGYYDAWNNSPDKDVRACVSMVFPTDRKPLSR